MNVIGISAFFHDAACCLLEDGALVAAAEEERFTRRKHDPSLPVHAFRYCLEQGGLSIADVDCVAYYENPQKKLSRQLWGSLPDLPSADAAALFKLDGQRANREIRQRLGFTGTIELVEHHLSHAASSFFYSGFGDAAILTVDGVGEWTTTAYGRARGTDIELFEEVHFPDSMGILYSTITSYLGFEVNDAEYKIMGLAPYGRPVYRDQISRLVANGPDGQFRLDLTYFDFLHGERMYSRALVDLFREEPREPDSEIRQFHQDVASSLQAVLEELLLSKAEYLHRRVPSENLCMAGGVALNCVANGRLLRDGPFKRLFVQPAASDAGAALGAAAMAHIRLSGRRPTERPLTQVYLGPSYGADEIASLLRSAEVTPIDCRERTQELVSRTAEYLAEGRVVGWFQGRMEFGPRALGNRSILADSRDPTMRDTINARVKMREAFRPFAPAVLEAEAARHFELDHPSRFMLESCQVRSALSLPAITHVDGSARVQTVSDEDNPLFAGLLREFFLRTGCPILLNTSFNLRGEPIVMTPFDAFACYVRSDIDVLVLGDFIVTRDAVTPFMREMGALYAGSRRAQQPAVTELAYTFI
jgi:carbamoyltransferase